MQVSARGVLIEVDDQGPPQGEPLLLIMGLGMPLTAWPEAFVALLVQRGFRVIRFDNRDAGLSQGFDEHGVPSLGWSALRHMLHLRVPTPYTLADMAGDAEAVLDALGLASAHVCGASMGGMIAQHLAAKRAQRVRSLTLMMTSSGARSLPQPSLRVRAALLKRPHGHDTEAVVAHLEQLLHVIGSPGYRPDLAWQRDRLRAMVTRAWRPAGTARQLVAVAADGDRSPLLKLISAPTVIVHGIDDPLVRVQAGHALVRQIAGAEADFIDGMGHDLPPALLPRFTDAIVAVAARASKA